MDYLQIPTGDSDLDRHLGHVWNVEWASTSLGPLEAWPQEMAMLLHVAMLDPNPRLLVLGQNNYMLYNAAYGKMIGELHPQALGKDVIDVWPDQRAMVLQIHEYVRATGQVHVMEDVAFQYRRNGIVEEVYLNWCTAPLKGPFQGFLVSLNEVTEGKIADRRRTLLRSLSENWGLASDVASLWENLSQSLESLPDEFPFALAYSAAPGPENNPYDFILDAEEPTLFILKGFAGQPSIQPFIQPQLDIENGSEQYIDTIKQVVLSKEPQVMKIEDGMIPESWTLAASGRGSKQDLTTVVICPVRSNRTAKTVGILILGLNTKRKWNEAYSNWISDMGREFNDIMTTLLLADFTAKAQHEIAKQTEREQVLLAKELAAREREASTANNMNMRLLKMMEGCDVGIFEYSPDGKLVHANESWYKLSGHPKPAYMHTEFSFMDCVYEPDRHLVLDAWSRLLAGEQFTFEMRWKAQQLAPAKGENPPQDGQWVLSTCFPVMDEAGVLVAISGCVTDIGPQKRLVQDALRRAEATERARASEREASRANERFQRMRNVIDQIDVGVFEYYADGRLLHANDAYFVLSGMDREESFASTLAFAKALHPDSCDFAMEKWMEICSGKPQNFEYKWRAPHKAGPGQEDPGQWVLAAWMPVLDEAGVVTSVFGCITDIDAQKQAEADSIKRAEALERARASEHRFVRFTESAAMPIYILEHRSKLMTYCNAAWFTLTGLPRTEYTGVDWQSVIHEEDLSIINDMWAKVIERQETVSTQFRLKRTWTGTSGEVLSSIWIMATGSPEFNEDGTVKGIMGTMSDITGFKFAENVQQLRVDEAIEAKRQQENFIDMTSHEIRNPLGAVVHCADSITDSLSEMKDLTGTLRLPEHVEKLKHLLELIESCSDAVSTITSCSAHQKRIVDDILVLSKLDSNLLQIAPSSIYLHDLLRDVQKMFEAEAQRAEVNIKTVAHASLTAMNIQYALLDPGRALQILINLVTNAIKFTKNRETRDITICMGASTERPSEKELHVEFAVNSMRDSIYEMPQFAESTFYVWFTVQDTGRGMTPDEKARIFSRFTQGSPRTYSEYGGSGLGLFISRELAGLQGGEIGVASELDKGSTFAFFIKTRHTEPPKTAPVDLPLRTTGETEAAARPAHEISILVTEDNLLNQKVLKKQLSKHGYKVYTADNGQEALDFLRTSRRWKQQQQQQPKSATTNGTTATEVVDIDVILMDLEMPVMGGLEAARNVRAHQRAGDIQGHIPIIAVSANARAEQTNAAIAAGMDDAIAKPFRIVDLIPKIERLSDWVRTSQT